MVNIKIYLFAMPTGTVRPAVVFRIAEGGKPVQGKDSIDGTGGRNYFKAVNFNLNLLLTNALLTSAAVGF